MGVIQVLGDSTKTSGNFELKKEGYYTIRILEVTDQSTEGKAPAVRIGAEIIGGPAHIGEPVSNFMTLAEWNAGNWRSLCDNAGVPYQLVPTPNGKEGISLDTEHLLQKIVGIKIAHRQGKGANADKTFENWVEYFAPQQLQQGAPVSPAAMQPPVQYPPQGAQPQPAGYAPPHAQHQAGQGTPPPPTQYNPPTGGR